MEYQSIMDALETFHCNQNTHRKKKYLCSIIIVIILYILLIVIGTIIFKYLFDITWLNAIYAAALVFCGIDLEVIVITDGQKIFIIIYAIISVILLLSMANLAVEYFFELYI